MLYIVCYGLLDGCGGLLVQPSHRSVRIRSRRRSQVKHDTRLRRRMRTEEHSRRFDYDVADVDRIRNHARIRGFCRIRERDLLGQNVAMEMDACFDLYTAVLRHDTSLPVSRVATMVSLPQDIRSLNRVPPAYSQQVHGKRQIRQSIPSHEEAPQARDSSSERYVLRIQAARSGS